MSRWIAAAIAACMLLSTAPAFAATSGIVRGVVTQSGTPKAGATVTLVRSRTTLHSQDERTRRVFISHRHLRTLSLDRARRRRNR